jgi:DNA-binding MarR family transcriptional regulator
MPDELRAARETGTENPASKPPSTGRFSYDGLERAIHEKARLGIMTSLATHPKGLLFGDLKELCQLTDGNLSRHLHVLQEEGLVEVWKGQPKRRPQTLVRLTDEGRRRFLDYIAELEHVVADALAAAQAADISRRSEGWSPI